jgi:hypothetical protein
MNIRPRAGKPRPREGRRGHEHPHEEHPCFAAKKRDRAAIAAYNDAEGGMLLPPDAVRLLAVMFPRSPMFRGAVGSLVSKGFDNRTLLPLLRALAVAGFLSKDPGRRSLITTYHLHLPPRRQP